MLLYESVWRLASCVLGFSIFIRLSAGQKLDSSISRCPIRCNFREPTSWTYYYDLSELDGCDGTTVFQLSLNNKVDDPNTDVYYRACTASGGTVRPVSAVDTRVVKRQQLAFNGTTQLPNTVTLSAFGESGQSNLGQARSVMTALHQYLQRGDRDGTIAFSRSGQTVAGLYVGTQVSMLSAAAALDQFQGFLSRELSAKSTVAQACGTSNQTIGPQFFGTIVDTQGDVATVQEALRSWINAECIGGGSHLSWSRIDIDIVAGTSISIAPIESTEKVHSAQSRDTESSRSRRQSGTCQYTQVQSGDGCWAISQRCGISQSELEAYNRANLCNSLKVAEYACCSAGSLPDFTPQPGSDGMCLAHIVQPDDSCFSIAEAHQMTVADIESRNAKTWGWTGCDNVLLGARICLSTGDPPFPAEVPNAVCGPQVPGTANRNPSRDPQDWINLNECPLHACCNIWGQCGVTSEFCTVAPSKTGNPGTAAPGSNGCVSNCGTDIISGPAPATFEHVGYYEAYHVDRPCNFMSISDIPDAYTIVHWAFGDILDDFSASISPYEADWRDFKAATAFKRIISFGGWAFSTERSSYYIFREGVKSGNRQRFANSVINFVVSEGLDGVDFDWEYPGAPDDQGSGIPVDAPERALDYLEFLKLVRAGLPSSLTIGMAAPASFWYLKAFPMDKIAAVVDYVIYMTYDMHGQWDYGNKFTSPGCPAGDCLRTHINRTETETSLSMITKAGVPARKIFFGQPLYGRSFKMAQAGCWTENCKFTGPTSGARPGRCTGTGGYLSNLEIREIIEGGQHSVQEHYTEEVGDILVYDDTEWVSWAKRSTYDARTEWARSLGLGGISDWAIDLDKTGSRDGAGNGNGAWNGTGEVVYIDPSLYGEVDPTAYCQPPCTFVFPPWILPYTTTITPSPVTSTILNRWTDIVNIPGPGGVTTIQTTTFETTTVTVITIPPITTTEIEVWNYIWTDPRQSVVTLTSSIQFPPVTLTQDPTSYTLSNDPALTTVLGVTYTFLPGPFPLITANSQTPTRTTTPSPGQTPRTSTSSTTVIVVPPPDQTSGPPPVNCVRCPPSINIDIGPPGPRCRIFCGRLCLFSCGGGRPCFPPSGTCNCIGGACPSFPCFGLGCIDFPPGTFPPPGGPLPGGSPPPNDPNEPTQSQSTRSSSSSSSSSSRASSCAVRTPAPSSNYPAPDEPAPILGQGGMGGTGAAGGGGGGGGPIETVSDGPVRQTSGSSPVSTSYISCSTQNQQPGQGITQAYCVCSGSTFAQSTATNPPNSCAYTTLPGPSQTISISLVPPLQPSRTPTPRPEAEPTPTPTPTPEPPAPLPSALVIVARMLLVVSNRQPLLTWSWTGYSADASEADFANYCDTSEYPQLFRKGVGQREPPRYPDQLGPFALGGHKDCQYTGTSTSVGGVKCGDGFEASCKGYAEDYPVLDCAQPDTQVSRDDVHLRVRCDYGE